MWPTCRGASHNPQTYFDLLGHARPSLTPGPHLTPTQLPQHTLTPYLHRLCLPICGCGDSRERMRCWQRGCRVHLVVAKHAWGCVAIICFLA